MFRLEDVSSCAANATVQWRRANASFAQARGRRHAERRVVGCQCLKQRLGAGGPCVNDVVARADLKRGTAHTVLDHGRHRPDHRLEGALVFYLLNKVADRGLGTHWRCRYQTPFSIFWTIGQECPVPRSTRMYKRGQVIEKVRPGTSRGAGLSYARRSTGEGRQI